ncbi:hypothetical protein DM860_002134 [Cuscuta australis]|uniref:Uncharacterized protein n=1 Tax=Cuscuta australis TaxID=267555 RepID=A0A328E0A9_9ASTE|nr:hypothetical protein DM860_002134 [Cuscuta australis]
MAEVGITIDDDCTIYAITSEVSDQTPTPPRTASPDSQVLICVNPVQASAHQALKTPGPHPLLLS